MKGRLFLVDGNALAYRAHFAFINSPLTNSKGAPTSAVFGYVSALLRILKGEHPEYVAVAFDRPEPTFRHQRYTAYKATRDKQPEEMTSQMPVIKELTEALGVTVLEEPGYEADDLIGAAARRAAAEGLHVFIVSGDKDMMQLVSDRVTMYDIVKPGRSEPIIVDEKGVEEHFGVPPDKVVDVLGLMGDTSDNVPGVPGIGPKKACALIREFGSLEEALARAPAGKPSKMNENLIRYADQARLSKELVTIDVNAPLRVSIEDLKRKPQHHARVVNLFAELEFTQLLKEVGAETAEAVSAEGYRVARTEAELDALVAELRAAGFFVYDTETSELDPYGCDLVGMSFSTKPGEGVYVPCLGRKEPLEKLRGVLEDESLPKGGQNMKFDAQVLWTCGVVVKNLHFDTMIASYLLDPGRGVHSLDSLCVRHLGVRKQPIEELIGKGKERITMSDVPLEKISRYASEDADCTYRLVEVFKPRLEQEGLDKLFREVEMPLVPVLVAMERAGVKVDTDVLEEMSNELTATEERLLAEIRDLAGEPVNVNSPKQLGPILFEKLEIHKATGKRPRRTQTGYATDARTLSAYADHPIVAKLLEYREVNKLRGTYVDALPKMVNPRTGRIHPTFHQTVAATGRLSCSDPNLQNIPIRTEMGRRIRAAFVAEKGCKLLSADYSQIELRLMAHLSQDPGLIDVFARGGDVHAETASRMFGLPLAQVTREQRNSAKAINFGILYGMGPQRLARDLKISMDEARAFLAAYFREFPAVKAFQEEAVQRARREGYVTTLLGRRRALPEVLSPDPPIRAAAENMARNTPLQGTAADMIKVAMIRVQSRLTRERRVARMLLQVHDELVFEVPDQELQAVEDLVRHEMAHALELSVPVVVDVGVGESWLEAH